MVTIGAAIHIRCDGRVVVDVVLRPECTMERAPHKLAVRYLHSTVKRGAGLFIAPEFVLNHAADGRIVTGKTDMGGAGMFELVNKVHIENVGGSSFRVRIKLGHD